MNLYREEEFLAKKLEKSWLITDGTKYKGYAYITNIQTDEAIALFGETPEDIIEKLKTYNSVQTEENRFRTCNIGYFDVEKNKYIDFHKYDIATCKDISSYLKIPPMKTLKIHGLQRLIEELSAIGAKFNPVKKEWHITTNGEAKREAAKIADRIEWSLSGSKIPYYRKIELSQMLCKERDGTLQVKDWRQHLSQEEAKLVNWWDNLKPQLSSYVLGQGLAPAYGFSEEYQQRARLLTESIEGKQSEVVAQDDIRVHIGKDIIKSGYRPTEKLISNIRKLDLQTGKTNTMKDICRAYKNGCAGMDQGQKDTIGQIAEECKQQELARMAAPPEV